MRWWVDPNTLELKITELSPDTQKECVAFENDGIKIYKYIDPEDASPTVLGAYENLLDFTIHCKPILVREYMKLSRHHMSQGMFTAGEEFEQLAYKILATSEEYEKRIINKMADLESQILTYDYESED